MSVISEGTILIVRRELTAALQDRLSVDPAVRVYSASDAHAALTTVMKHHVPVVVLDRRFATTPGGNEFVRELRTSCRDVEIRILGDNGDELPPALQTRVVEGARAAIARHSELLRGPIRKSPRYPVPAGSALLVNGEIASLVNVSETGVQLVSPAMFRPAQPVRIALPHGAEEFRLQGAVAWSAFELSRGAAQSRYRVGLEFAHPKPELVRVYITDAEPDVE